MISEVLERSLLALIFAALALAFVPTTALAKDTAWVIAGGELAPYAEQSFDAPDLPGAGALPVAPPDVLPSLSYDLYNSWGNFAVAYQIANGGAEFRYYPTARLLSHRTVVAGRALDRWYAASPATGEALDSVIAAALRQKAAGELEVGPVAADLRARSMDKVAYLFTPLPAAGAGLQSVVENNGIDDDTWQPIGAQISGDASREFILRHIVETVSRAPKRSSAAPPDFQITYEGKISAGGGIGGLLGYYALPRNGEPGRFWDDAYVADNSTPYYETSAQFDAFIDGALGGGATQPPAPEGAAAPSAGGSAASSPLIGISIAVAVGVAMTLALRTIHRRRGRQG